MQEVVDGCGDADPFLLRSMQRFVDDRRNLVADLEAGDGPEWLPYDRTNWNNSVGGERLSRRSLDLGVKW